MQLLLLSVSSLIYCAEGGEEIKSWQDAIPELYYSRIINVPTLYLIKSKLPHEYTHLREFVTLLDRTSTLIHHRCTGFMRPMTLQVMKHLITGLLKL